MITKLLYNIAVFETAFLGQDEWEAIWIGNREMPSRFSYCQSNYSLRPSLLRRAVIHKEIRQARAYVAGLVVMSCAKRQEERGSGVNQARRLRKTVPAGL